ncbi:hypothetical protein [Nocardia canadensis]|uniref:hypothetical protein n=1 Tax=Nocardia canadensis TaxID=3065238 RepID=UPI00293196EA|nr:hypothetical protein [Nocardia canadensis]
METPLGEGPFIVGARPDGSPILGYEVARYEELAPNRHRPRADSNIPVAEWTKVEGHHGVPSVLAQHLVWKYREGRAPAVSLPVDQHKATTSALVTWLSRVPAAYRTDGKPDAQKVAANPKMVDEVVTVMWDAAKVPQNVRVLMRQKFEQYRLEQEYERRREEYDVALSQWKLDYGPAIDLPPPKQPPD